MFDERDLLNVYHEPFQSDESFLHPATIANASALRKHSSDALHAIDYAKFHSRSQDAVVRVYDKTGNMIKRSVPNTGPPAFQE